MRNSLVSGLFGALFHGVPFPQLRSIGIARTTLHRGQESMLRALKLHSQNQQIRRVTSSGMRKKDPAPSLLEKDNHSLQFLFSPNIGPRPENPDLTTILNSWWEDSTQPSAFRTTTMSRGRPDTKHTLHYLWLSGNELWKRYCEDYPSFVLSAVSFSAAPKLSSLRACLLGCAGHPNHLEMMTTILQDGYWMFRSRRSLLESRPYFVKDASPADFSCPVCRRMSESKRTLASVLAKVHANCPEECNRETLNCIAAKSVVDAQKVPKSDLEYEEKFGTSRLKTLFSIGPIFDLHLKRVTSQRQFGYQEHVKYARVPENNACVVIMDFTGVIAMKRSRDGGMTQGEMRNASLGLLDVAVVVGSELVYFDFIDADKRDNVDVVRFCVEKVVRFLMLHGISQFDVWSDTCAAHFLQVHSLSAILIDMVNSIIATPPTAAADIPVNTDGVAWELNPKTFPLMTAESIPKLKNFRWNFFVPYHGKCLCNGHFGTLKVALRIESKAGELLAGAKGVFDTIKKMADAKKRQMKDDEEEVLKDPTRKPLLARPYHGSNFTLSVPEVLPPHRRWKTIEGIRKLGYLCFERESLDLSLSNVIVAKTLTNAPTGKAYEMQLLSQTTDVGSNGIQPAVDANDDYEKDGDIEDEEMPNPDGIGLPDADVLDIPDVGSMFELDLLPENYPLTRVETAKLARALKEDQDDAQEISAVAQAASKRTRTATEANGKNYKALRSLGSPKKRSKRK